MKGNYRDSFFIKKGKNLSRGHKSEYREAKNQIIQLHKTNNTQNGRDRSQEYHSG